jgi:NAD(P)-dependent dehydrogenase (short-subunit alcohol dehydrogenase family)
MLGAVLILVAAASVPATSSGQSPGAAAGMALDDMQTVLITGANRGIGLELARQYAEAGWRVVGTARNPDSATELRQLGADVVQLDVTKADSVARFAQELDDRPVDLLINNAGILPYVRSLEEVDFSDFERALAVNTTGPARVTQAVIDNLRAGQLKTIVNITSILGSIAENSRGGLYGYRESKAGLNMFTRSLAAEFGPEGFTCIVIHPGWVQTDMGGASATTPVEVSVGGIRRVIGGLSAEDNGSFWTFEGKQLPW